MLILYYYVADSCLESVIDKTLQELVVIIKSKKPLREMELLDDPLKLHRINIRTFVDQQKFSLYDYVDSFYPMRSWDELQNPSLLVKCVAARRWEYYLTNLFFMSVRDHRHSVLCC